MAISRISAVFDADASGLKNAIREAGGSVRALGSDMATAARAMQQLESLGLDGLKGLGTASSYAGTQMAALRNQADQLHALWQAGGISAEAYLEGLRSVGAAAAESVDVSKRAAAVVESLVTAEQKHARELDNIRDLYAKGALGPAEYAAAVTKLQKAMYESSDAYKAEQAAIDARNRLLEEGQRVTQSTMTAQERYTAEVARLNKLKAAGVISEETFARALTQAKSSLDGASTSTKKFADSNKALADVMSRLNVLTVAAFADIASKIASVVGRAASGLYNMAAASAAAIDNLSKLAERSGRAYSEMAALEMAGNLAGVGVEQMAGAMDRADRLFDAARNGSQAATQAFTRLGLDLENLGKMSGQARFDAIAKSIASLPDPAARTAASMQIFGRSGAELLPMFMGMADAMQQAQQDADRFGLSLTNLQGKDVEGMNDAFTRAGYAITGVITQVEAKLAPAIKTVVDTFTQFVSDAGGVSIGSAIVDAFWNAGEILARSLDLMSAAVAPVIGAFSNVFNYFAEVLTGSGGFSETINWWGVATEVFQRAVSLLEGIFKNAIAGFQAIVGAFAKVGEWLLGAMAKAVELIPMMGKYADDIRAMQAGTGDFADSMFDGAMAWSAEAGKNVANAFSAEFKPTQLGSQITGGMTGGMESFVERWRKTQEQAAADSARGLNQGNKDGVGGALGAAVSDGLGKLAQGIRADSKEGRQEMLRLMYGGGDDIDQKQLKAQERAADAGERMADFLEENLTGFEAYAIQ